MNDKVSQLFKDWVIAVGKAPTTTNRYYSGVNTASKHRGHDIFTVADLTELGCLYRLYEPNVYYPITHGGKMPKFEAALDELLRKQRELTRDILYGASESHTTDFEELLGSKDEIEQ